MDVQIKKEVREKTGEQKKKVLARLAPNLITSRSRTIGKMRSRRLWARKSPRTAGQRKRRAGRKATSERQSLISA